MKILKTISFLCLLVSCSEKDSENTTNSDSDNNVKINLEKNFYGLKVGNEFVYKSYIWNKYTEVYADINVIDSVEVVSEQVIKGEVYFKILTKTTGNDDDIAFCNPNGTKVEFLRDSLGYLVNEKGRHYFSYKNKEKFFLGQRPNLQIFQQLEDTDNTIKTNAGIFKVVQNSIKVYIKDENGELTNETMPGKDTDNFSPYIGRVLKTFSRVNSEQPIIERRLESYKVE